MLKISGDDVVIDIGLKSEGVVPRREFLAPDGSLRVHPGDQVDVIVERDDEGGGLRLSHERAVRLRLWDELEKAYRENTIIHGHIVERVKGWATGY